MQQISILDQTKKDNFHSKSPLRGSDWPIGLLAKYIGRFLMIKSTEPKGRCKTRQTEGILSICFKTKCVLFVFDIPITVKG